ncbi:NUDIX domain-containing protein [Reyranella sp. CPCC 100927]|uniref:NUDIX domain-containing protein n=1 Tax=Reyranella sp. CPCC 100927 TaxID=2599616 RepID=UPI0011B5C969|nr:NUDIX hydrolase [Reyranella sp. CPCC 100927]TWT02834.1 NUDIX hydrolase [Reyranella sp. CPCC 100927]
MTATHRHGHPVSVKGVLFVDRQVLLLRNDRDEWELPGGRPEAAETWPQALQREIDEEANLSVEVGPLLHEWPYEVLPGRCVWIAAYGCQLARAATALVSAEHRELRFWPVGEIGGLSLHDGYRAVIDTWNAWERGRDDRASGSL